MGGTVMPRKTAELSAIQVRRLKTPGLHSVGGVAGLSLQVKHADSRSWILRTTIGGRRKEIGLGGFPDVTLELARQKARELREQINQGIDPATQRRDRREALRAAEAKRLTFRKGAEQFIERKQVEFRSKKHAAQWSATLETYAFPVIGDMTVDAIELAHIKKLLDPIWTTKTETAKRLRGRIESILAYATASGHRAGDNPARWRGNLDAVMPKPGKIAKVVHHRALPVDDMPAFMADLRQREGMAAGALEFAILTAARSGEVRFATWEEIDPDTKTWTIPAERMKAGRTHRIPLSADALAVLKAVPRMARSPYVFPAPRGGALSDMSLSAVCRRMQIDAVPHGFRSTFRDWCSERTAYPREVCEQALAHAISDAVEAAYRRGDLFDKRIKLMDRWAQFCNQATRPEAVVTPIRGAK